VTYWNPASISLVASLAVVTPVRSIGVLEMIEESSELTLIAGLKHIIVGFEKREIESLDRS